MNCNGAVNVDYKSLYGHILFLLGLGQMGCTVGLCLTLKKMTMVFSRSLCHLISPPAVYENLFAPNLH